MQNKFSDHCDICKKEIDVRYETHLCVYQSRVVRVCDFCHEEVADDHILGDVQEQLRRDYA